MTAEKAIKILNTVLAFGRCDCQNGEIEECLKMAIQALGRQSSEEDYISRKSVIQIIENKLNPCTDMFKCLEMSEIKEDVEHLPSVISREQHCDDCISRQEAISAIQDEYYDHAVGIDIVDIIAHLPPVIPKAESEDKE